jgi:hypothetical protein
MGLGFSLMGQAMEQRAGIYFQLRIKTESWSLPLAVDLKDKLTGSLFSHPKIVW